jgi:hypothetical protein
MRPLLTLEDIAERMQVEPDWLRSRLGTLCTRHGFPRALPLPGIRRWDPFALEIWENSMLAARGAASAADVAVAIAPPASAVAPEEEDGLTSAVLDERARAIAGQPLKRRAWSALRVARDLGVEADWFRQNYGLLSARLGFPSPLPNRGFRYPCWDGLAIDRWRPAALAADGTSLPDFLRSAPIADRDTELSAAEDDPWAKNRSPPPLEGAPEEASPIDLLPRLQNFVTSARRRPSHVLGGVGHHRRNRREDIPRSIWKRLRVGVAIGMLSDGARNATLGSHRRKPPPSA